MRETEVADTETLLWIIQSIPSPKAEPFQQWLAKVGYERMKEIADKEQDEFAMLTNIIHEEWTDLIVNQHKQLKGWKR